MRLLITIILIPLFFACKQETKQLTAQQIIDKTIENAGGKKYDNAAIQFTFRGTQYNSSRNNGQFELSRSFTDSLGDIKDVLNNDGFERFVNGEKMNLPDSTATKYANSVNSVHYFAELPYGLNEAAVEKELVDTTEINGKKYYEVKVTFKQEGGGVDHGDIYMYWISQKDFTVDYFAYKYYTGKGGIRFRTAYNPRMVNGIRFADYKNYKAEPWKSVEVQDLDEMFEAGKLELLSDIKTEDVSVENDNR